MPPLAVPAELGGAAVIAAVRGEVLVRNADEVVIDVGGVGISVLVTARTAASLQVGDQAALTTQLVVREDSLTLYGFADAAEREIFLQVQTVSGIGPKLAMTMLGTLSADQIREAISTEDERLLTTVSGLGRKSAQRLIVDLKDKLGPVMSVATPAGSVSGSWRAQVIAALTGLGWAPAQAQEAVVAVAARDDADSLAVAEALRLALQTLDHTTAVKP